MAPLLPCAATKAIGRRMSVAVPKYQYSVGAERARFRSKTTTTFCVGRSALYTNAQRACFLACLLTSLTSLDRSSRSWLWLPLLLLLRHLLLLLRHDSSVSPCLSLILDCCQQSAPVILRLDLLSCFVAVGSASRRLAVPPFGSIGSVPRCREAPVWFSRPQGTT